MDSLSNLAISKGILYPIVKYQFRVVFKDDAGAVLPYGNDLSMQVKSISDYEQTRGEESQFVIEFEEDVTGKASTALQQLYSIDDTFKIVIEYLNGEEAVIKTASFESCFVRRIIHGSLDYAGGGKRSPQLRLKTPLWNGALVDELNENPTTRALLTVLNGAQFTFDDGYDAEPMTVNALAYVSFNKVVIS